MGVQWFDDRLKKAVTFRQNELNLKMARIGSKKRFSKKEASAWVADELIFSKPVIPSKTYKIKSKKKNFMDFNEMNLL